MIFLNTYGLRLFLDENIYPALCHAGDADYIGNTDGIVRYRFQRNSTTGWHTYREYVYPINISVHFHFYNYSRIIQSRTIQIPENG